MVRKNKRRRGVVILIVLSLLVLFTLLVVTYAIVSGQYRRAAEAFARQELLGVQPQKDLDRAFYQILRDTPQRTSAVRYHSLLRDYYGEDGFRGQLIVDSSVIQDWNTNPAHIANGGLAHTISNGQFRDLIVHNVDATSLTDMFGQTFQLTSGSYPPGFCVGRVLTVTSGPATGWSTMIVAFFYRPDTGAPVLRVLDLQTDSLATINWTDLSSAQFVVNGRPFNGTGVGFQIVTDSHPVTGANVQVAKLNASVTVNTSGGPVAPAALLPHHVARDESGSLLGAVFNLAASNNALVAGGSNEPYDAVDYQNMFLGLVLPNAATSRDIIPSLHRPALINYWANQNGGAYWADDNFKRLITLRPIEVNFDGSNPEFAAAWASYLANRTDPPRIVALRDRFVSGPWDVDNDGDGIADSVWVDLGLPAQTAPDGRKYKPLFAILCVDLDGRLNVNAHGNPSQFYANRPGAIPLAVGDTTGFPKGLGYGPGEISLSGVTSSLNLLMGERYGSDGAPGAAGSNGMVANDSAFDLLARVKFFEEPQNYFSGIGGLSSYHTPSDLRGELAFGLDLFGRPVWEQVPAAVVESRADSPYELNLIDGDANDRPFTPAELERVLRRFDVDVSQLPDRLSNVLNLTAVENARLVTTDSFDPPVPGTALISDLADTWTSKVGSAQQLITARLLDNGVAASAVPGLLKNLMPSELLLGQRLDINRPLGNARDDTPAGTAGHRLVDEVGEQANEQIWANVGPAVGTPPYRSEFQNVPVYHTNGADVNNDNQLTINDHLLARQLLARHIYVLLMALRDSGYLIDTNGDGTPTDAETAYALAQYAVNIVDFRDADSIMTPFEFDIYPFDAGGWEVDGNPLPNSYPGETSNRGVVWGCERPELVISETLAWHDRRTEDLDNDNGIATRTTDGTNPDPTYDQRLRPRGSFFVELFNPWTSGTTVKPAELYDPPLQGVQLDKVSTDGATRSPVWRLMFVRDLGAGVDRDDTGPPADETRYVYFINPTQVGATLPPTSGVNNVYATTIHGAAPLKPFPPVSPGSYVVIGSEGINDGGGNYISPVGRTTNAISPSLTLGDLDLTNSRRVVLTPGDGGNNEVHILNNGLPAVVPGVPIAFPSLAGQPADVDILAATAIVINAPQPLSVSEPPELPGDPANDYPVGTFTIPGPDGEIEGSYSPPHDEPLDLTRYGGVLMTNGTLSWGTLHLQRLANPNLTYNAQTNPYRTIDSQRVDLTSFNGVTSATHASEPDGNTQMFAVQRGDQQGGDRRFWPQEPFGAGLGTPPADRGQDLSGTHYFNFHLRSSLGSLNHGFWPYNGQTAGVYRGSPSVDLTDGFTENDQAFSSLAWNNRPFVSAYELMQVPVTQSSKLLRWYTLPLNAVSPYDTASPTPQYGHLVNFFHSSPFAQTDGSIHAYRLFEYVQVPSRFVGSDLVLNPNSFRNHLLPSPPYPANTPNRIANPATLNPSFLTPFNRLARYREPGRVNINTIFHPRVWNAMFDGYTGQSYDAIVASRRGFAAGINTLLPTPDPNFPTYFANPFRPPGHGSLAPLSHLERYDIETTLLRSDAVPPDYGTLVAPPPANNPLLQGGHVGANTASLTSTHHRNSHFRYNALRRLGNMVTTRSNVYAIWITVGYFEVEPNIPTGQALPVVDVFHPDGFRVGQEVGLDTGQVRRHRAFYMVDRTIPVAFQPGENHNVDRCVLLRRYIE
ncbi:MAG: hypothetical protein KJ000_30755 [Pirellulaceae bacterium]|nr:hypothetical protein [Pirellulaceae bacterium]